jgi:hypothetical protein
MSLFECPKCGAVENTATGEYWTSTYPTNSPHYKPARCSECATGKWHGEFPKRTVKEAGYIHGDDGYLYSPDELAPGGYSHGRVKPLKEKP